jgi:TPR repeat protein
MTLGMMYEQGLGVPPDAAEAKKWYAVAERAGAEQSGG